MGVKDERFISEYERGLISLILRTPDLLTDLQQRITSEYFLSDVHNLIYRAVIGLYTDRNVRRLDIDTVSTECEKLGGLKSFGVDNSYLTILYQGGFDRENYEFYLEEVREAYLKYTLATKLEKAFLAVRSSVVEKDRPVKAENLMGEINSEISKLQTFQGVDSEAVLFCDRIESFIEERAAAPTEVRGLRTGYPTLDRALNGLMDGGVTIMAGRAKAGKSTVLLNIANYVAIEAGIITKSHPVAYPVRPVLMISTEMYTDEDLSRMLAIRTLLPERQISNGTILMDPTKREIIIRATEEIKNSLIIHIFMPDFNPTKVANTIFHYKARYNIGLAIFDYIKVGSDKDFGGNMRNSREDQLLGDLTNALKMTAGKLKIPILTAAQIGRNGLVADSDRILRYCNSLVGFRPRTVEERAEYSIHDHGTHIFEIKDTRAGGYGSVPVFFFKSCSKIIEAPPFPVKEEEAQDDPDQAFTTPDEYRKARDSQLKLETANGIMNMKDAHDLKIPTIDDPPIGEDDDPEF